MGVLMLPVLSTREFLLRNNCELPGIFCGEIHCDLAADSKSVEIVTRWKPRP
jgi:hypothetical protein